MILGWSMLDAVYIDTKNNLIVAIKPKPPFKPIFQVAASREKSDIYILNEPFKGSSLFLVETGESRTPHLEDYKRTIFKAVMYDTMLSTYRKRKGYLRCNIVSQL